MYQKLPLNCPVKTKAPLKLTLSHCYVNKLARLPATRFASQHHLNRVGLAQSVACPPLAR